MQLRNAPQVPIHAALDARIIATAHENAALLESASEGRRRWLAAWLAGAAGSGSAGSG